MFSLHLRDPRNENTLDFRQLSRSRILQGKLVRRSGFTLMVKTVAMVNSEVSLKANREDKIAIIYCEKCWRPADIYLLFALTCLLQCSLIRL